MTSTRTKARTAARPAAEDGATRTAQFDGAEALRAAARGERINHRPAKADALDRLATNLDQVIAGKLAPGDLDKGAAATIRAAATTARARAQLLSGERFDQLAREVEALVKDKISLSEFAAAFGRPPEKGAA